MYIGKDGVLPARGVADQQVSVGIRRKDFFCIKMVLCAGETQPCGVMGRDISVVCEHPAALSPKSAGLSEQKTV